VVSFLFPSSVTFLWTWILIRCSVLCSELAVKLIDEPFISALDDKEEWAL
jgi:hypothetical protein